MNSIPLETELKRNYRLKKKDIEALKVWHSKQPHLPKIQDRDLALFLHNNFYLVEKAKLNIENYFTMKTQFTEFFFDRDPVYCMFLRLVFNIVKIVHLPGRTKQGYDVILTRLVEPDPISYFYDDMIKYLLMVLDLLVHERGTNIKGCVFVFDFNGTKSKLGTYMSQSMKRFFEYAKKGSLVRWISLHYLDIGSPHYCVQTIIAPNDYFDKVYLHLSMNGLYRFVWEDILPIEMGGSAGSLQDLHKAQMAKLQSSRQWFLSYDKESKVVESLRLAK